MADNSWDIDSFIDFHPCDTPHGMKDYILKDLTEDQQILLNIRKREEIRNNQHYLSQHPEIRGIIAIILRILMRTRPKYNIVQAIGRYFTQPSVDVKEEVYAYLKERENILGVNSATTLRSSEDRISGVSEEISANFKSSSPVKPSVSTKASVADTQEIIAQLFEDRPDKPSVDFGKDEDSSEEICKGILQNLLEDVMEYIDETDSSLGSFGSGQFPKDYEDNGVTVKSSESLDSDEDDDDDD